MRLIGILLGLSILTGCTSTKVVTEKSNLSYVSPIELKNTLYGYLEKDNKGYALTKFSYGMRGRDLGPWVNLNTGNPNWDTNKQITFNKLLESKNREYRYKTEKLFFDYSIDKAHLAYLGVITLGTAPLYMNNKYNVTFDQERMREALQQAINKISLEDRNKLLIFDEKYSALKAYREEALNSYTVKAKKIKTDMVVKVSDDSGFYKNEIDFKSLVKFKLNELPDIPQTIVRNIDELLSGFIIKERELINSWNLAAQTITQECKHTSGMNFSFEFHCPEVISIDNKALNFDSVIIKSKYFKSIIVKNFNHQDEYITHTFDGNNINILNKSKEFITLKNIAFYYNNRVATLKDLNREIPPESSFTKDNYIGINEFRINRRELMYSKLTMESAKNINTDFGFAIKYSVLSKGTEHTLYSKKSYKLIDIL